MRIVFTAIVHFIPSAQGRNYGIILTRPFSIQLSHSQICVLYPIAGYPNERIFGISCIGLLTHHSCRGSALLYSNFGKTLLWHVPDLFQSGS